MKTWAAPALFILLAAIAAKSADASTRPWNTPKGWESGLPSSAVKAPASIYPEAKDLPVHPEMPDVLTMFDGTRVANRVQWQARRAEVKAILEHYELGHAPPPPGNVSGEDLKSQTVLGGAAKYRLVHLKFGPNESLGFDIAIFTPASGGPFATFINPSFFSTPGVGFTNDAMERPNPPPHPSKEGSAISKAGQTGPTVAERPNPPPRPSEEGSSSREGKPTTNPPPRFNFGSPVDPEKAAQGFSNQLSRGYAIVTYRYTQCGEDNTNYLNSSFYPAYPGYDWGVLYGWAWGLSRAVDYVETQSFADKTKLIALGHSRLGKLVMVAAAFDDRIAMAAPAGSAGAGTGAYRFCGPGRGGAEGIEDMTRKFPYYFVPRLKEFTGQMEKLPFDTHWFVALTAPRPWISLEGLDDKICRPAAVVQTVVASRPIYEFLGVSSDRVGANFERHPHGLPPEDWAAAMDFADKHLRGMKVERRFDRFPAEANAPSQLTTKNPAWGIFPSRSAPVVYPPGTSISDFENQVLQRPQSAFAITNAPAR